MKSFIIRILQVIWVLLAVAAFVGIIGTVFRLFDGDLLEGIGSIFGYATVLIVIQYLLLAKLDPRHLFNGSLNKKK
ncbi:hypothetical protein [Psychrobacter sp. CAL346-MNA-CIBAN-0220]|uniref:hypothetical protein n=1 Tax=Psychrobacter sp. CAL346-MNA-CIBAN-0220 TaxID=3140457 RepID=UPI00331F0BF2